MNGAVIIKRVKKVEAGGHHGGAWKVAYADFVTAMMAFFLLLWLLGSTTEAQRKGLADYFTPTLVKLKEQSAGGPGDVKLEDVVGYLQAQAKSAAHLQLMLAESEDKGFTFGINPDSRVALLSGFNQFVNTLQTDVPGAPGDDASAGE